MHQITTIVCLAAAWGASATAATAQNAHVPIKRCQAYGEPRNIVTPASPAQVTNSDALHIVRQVAAHAGLAANFTVQPGTTSGGAMAATCYDATTARVRRLIVYDPKFMAEIRARSASYWSLVGVLAHEIGHHVNGHNFERSVGHDKELEADRYAGFVLARMGASLEEALSGVRVYGEKIASATHPRREDREAAVAAGWRTGRPGPQGPATLSAAPSNPRIIRAPAHMRPLP